MYDCFNVFSHCNELEESVEKLKLTSFTHLNGANNVPITEDFVGGMYSYDVVRTSSRD